MERSMAATPRDSRRIVFPGNTSTNVKERLLATTTLHASDIGELSTLSIGRRRGGRNKVCAAGRAGRDDDDETLADDTALGPIRTGSLASQLKKHQERCQWLQALSRAQISRENQVIKTNVSVGIDALFKDVLILIRSHASHQCTPAVRKIGGDDEFMAMALTAELWNRLDPIEIFAPQKPRPAKQKAVAVASRTLDHEADSNGDKRRGASSVIAADDVGDGA